MTRLEALIALRNAVEANEDFIGHLSSKAFDPERHVLALRAYGEMQPRGSLDDAIALIEQSLPDYGWLVRDGDVLDGAAQSAQFFANIGPKRDSLASHDRLFPVWAPTPARALLLAILEALIAKEAEG